MVHVRRCIATLWTPFTLPPPYGHPCVTSSCNFHFLRTYGTCENYYFKLGPHPPSFPGELHFVKLVRCHSHSFVNLDRFDANPTLFNFISDYSTLIGSLC